MTEEVEKHHKEVAAAREQSAAANAEHVKELERTKKKADEVIQKHMLESLNARQEASEVKEKLSLMTEKCKTAENRVVEVEHKLAESSTAFEKLKLYSEKSKWKIADRVQSQGSSAQKEHTELKKKFQEMAEELERAYADKDKQKCELESKLNAAIERCDKTTELNFTAVRENLHLKDVEAKKQKAALITPPLNKHENQKSGQANADTFKASGAPFSSSSSTNMNSQNQTREQSKVTNGVMADLLEKERLKSSTICNKSKSKDAEIARLKNLISQQKKPSPPVTLRTSPPSTPADVKPQTLTTKRPDAPVTAPPNSAPVGSPITGFKPAHDSVNSPRSPILVRDPTNALKRMASTTSGGEPAKLPKIPKNNENQDPKENTPRNAENVGSARRTPEAELDNDCKIVKVINKKKPLQATKSYAAAVDIKPTIKVMLQDEDENEGNAQAAAARPMNQQVLEEVVQGVQEPLPDIVFDQGRNVFRRA
uniref:Uncharacterized protein n=1 Tax=Ditylenchus dipsaci TaxID=166011 RepID=A0A915EEB1_9BILA